MPGTSASTRCRSRRTRTPSSVRSVPGPASIPTSAPVPTDGGRIGIPYDVVTKRTPRTRVSFDYADESDRGPYPIPRRVHVESGSDRHALLIDRSACKLYELYALERTARGWRAGSGAVWSL